MLAFAFPNAEYPKSCSLSWNQRLRLGTWEVQVCYAAAFKCLLLWMLLGPWYLIEDWFRDDLRQVSERHSAIKGLLHRVQVPNM